MQDLGLLLLRIVAGVTLFAHGYPKLFGGPGKLAHPLLAKTMGPNYPGAVERSGPGFVAALEKMRVPNPRAAATASGLAELGGGVALAAGLFTRPAALAVTFNMGVATYKAHWKNGFYGQGGYEFSLLLGTVALSLFLTGPGRLSVDRLLSKQVANRPGVTWAVIVAFILLLYGTVMVFLAFDRVSHSNSDTIRPFIITMAPVWAIAVAAAIVLLRRPGSR